jgi:hypothetical protein
MEELNQKRIENMLEDKYITIEKEKLDEVLREAAEVKKILKKIIEEKQQNKVSTIIINYFKSNSIVLFPPTGWSGYNHYLSGDYALCFIFSATLGLCTVGYMLDIAYSLFPLKSDYLTHKIRYNIYPAILIALIMVVNNSNPELFIFSFVNTIIISLFLMNNINIMSTLICVATYYRIPAKPQDNLLTHLVYIYVINKMTGYFNISYVNDFKVFKYIVICFVPVFIFFYIQLMVMDNFVYATYISLVV